MKILKIATTFLFATVVGNVTYAQQWAGSTNTTQLIHRDGDISLYPNWGGHETGLGAAWGVGMSGNGYLGFNLNRDNNWSGLWRYASDGANNGGNVVWGGLDGALNFTMRVNTGNVNGTWTDADIMDNLKFKIENTGDLNLNRPMDASSRYIRAHTKRRNFVIMTGSGATDGPYIEMGGMSSGFRDGQINFVNYDVKDSRFAFIKYQASTGSWIDQVEIDNKGDVWVKRPTIDDAQIRTIGAQSEKGGINIVANKGSNDGAAMEVYGKDNSSYKGSIHFISHEDGDPNNIGFDFINYTGAGGWNSKMRIYKNGKVAIGGGGMNVFTTHDYGLYVEKGLLTSRVKVATVNGSDWADYVFADDYNLKPLNEVEAFINTNNHLPDVPSAADVEKDGIDMVKMDATLLQKVEELTLYIISQNKRIESLEKQLNGQK